MRLCAVMREACRNVISGTSRICCGALIFALCVAACVLADFAQISALIERVDTWISAGASTYLISAPGKIDGQACEHLESVQGVQAAGAVRLLDHKLTFETLLSSGIPVYEATPDAARVFGVDAVHGGRNGRNDRGDGNVVLSGEAADALGAKAGGIQRLADGKSVRITGVYSYPADGRRNDFEYAVLSEISDDKPFDTCLVRTWPVPGNIESLLYLTVDSLPKSDDPPRVGQLNATLGDSAPDANDFHARLTSRMPVVMVVIGVLLGGILTLLRRLELASALHAGYPKMGLLMQCLVETGAMLTAGMVAASPVFGYSIAATQTADRTMVTETLLRIPLAGCCGAMLGTAIVVLMIRESRLFVYFRNR